MAAAAMLDFKNFQVFNFRNGQEGRSASPCQISSKSVQPRLKCGDFSIIQDGAHFPQNDVTHRPNLQKDHLWAEPRHLIAMIGLSYTVTEI